MKITSLVEVFNRRVMTAYAELCGWTLAHAHARSGEPAKIVRVDTLGAKLTHRRSNDR